MNKKLFWAITVVLFASLILTAVACGGGSSY